MKMTLTRFSYTGDGIFSTLEDENDNPIAKTLEHSYDNVPKLTPGAYKCVRGIHKLHDMKPFETFEVLGVSGHTGILFHVGNWNKDSDGCVLLGEAVEDSPQGEMVTNSRLTFQKFMRKLEGVNEFELEVIG